MSENQIAIIDSEGIFETTGGSKKNKQTTLWVKKFAMVIYDPDENSIPFEKVWYIKMPIRFSELSEKTRRQWKYTHRIHQCTWDDDGITPYNLFWELDHLLSNVRCIYAKGKYMEERFINQIGLYGNSVYKDEYKVTPKTYIVKDLNKCNIRKYDDILYKRACYEYANGIRMKLNTIIIDNTMNRLPLPHSPLDECKEFLYEMINKRII